LLGWDQEKRIALVLSRWDFSLSSGETKDDRGGVHPQQSENKRREGPAEGDADAPVPLHCKEW
jgi:hypothetical protein